jgi:methionyl-tRNA formyltransferase
VRVLTSPRHAAEGVAAGAVSLASYLSQQGVECVIAEKLPNEEDLSAVIRPKTLGLSFGAAWIFRENFIDRFGGHLLNLHSTRLPQDRGAGGYSWQILRGNRLGCSLLHRIDAGVDRGEIVKSREFIYPPACRIPREYEEFCVGQDRIFLREFFEEVARGQEFTPTPQQECFSTYWPRLSTVHHGFIDWHWKAREIERFICAFDDPYAGASTFVNGIRVHLKSCFVDTNDGPFHPFQAGLVYRKSSEALFVAAEEGTLVVGRISDESGGDRFPSIQLGDRLITPREHLEEAQQFRAVYTPKGLKA